MLSPPAIPLVVRHLDSIDAFLAAKLTGIRPWLEPGLTSLLCDLLDDRTQADYSLAYPAAQLLTDLRVVEPFTSFAITVETHEYPPDVERWVTQADLGLVVRYRNDLLGVPPREAAWLLQAKRLYPSKEGTYSVASRFLAADAEQSRRIDVLNSAVGGSLVRYLLYCPRPASLGLAVEGALAQRRLRALDRHIFDFAIGLALRDELLAGGLTLAAGMFITEGRGLPSTLGEMHQRIFRGTTPFSWFLLEAMNGVAGEVAPGTTSDEGGLNPAMHRAIVRGDPEAVAMLREVTDLGDTEFRFLPAHTLEISIEVSIEDGDEPVDGDGAPVLQ